MTSHDLRNLLAKLVSDAETANEIAKTAEVSKQSLGGTGRYAHKFHDAVVAITTTEKKVRPHLTGLEVASNDLTAFDRHLLTVKDTAGSTKAKARTSAVRDLRLLCETVFIPKADCMTASPVPSTESVLPMAVVKGTKGNVEQIVTQINGCYEHQWYDACSVMIRKLAELLIIAVYEKNGAAHEIKDKNDNYLMLADLLTNFRTKKAVWHLGRETIPCLDEVKKRGDRSAHNRTYVANKQDVDNIISGLRVTIPDLIDKADYRYPHKS